MVFVQSIRGLIYGIVYGVAHTVPGLSGGTFLVIFGCYDIVCEAFALNIASIKKHITFLLPLGVGTLAGLVGFAHAITYLLENYRIQTNFTFMGLILGSVPLILKLASDDEKFTFKHLLPFVMGLGVVVSLALLERFGVFAGGSSQVAGTAYLAGIFAYAFIAAVAMVMPGISGAFVLVACGVYDVFMEAIKNLNLVILLPAIVGMLLGIIVGGKLMILIMLLFANILSLLRCL